ncbi:MAG TPA: homoserine dehydrogenase [Blastocatellia bacterium]|jgi:homoserine dehydrogenase|nr:homoserine dehydrogenase [Blastocatellia bacterium]
MELKLAFIGFGNVARAFARILRDRSPQLARQYDLTCRTGAIATGSHASVLSESAIDLDEAVALVERGASLKDLAGVTIAGDTAQVIKACDADIVFETTPLNPVDGEPAATYIRRALSRGINVVTANKGPIAFAHRELAALAGERGVRFRFEGTVMDGAPVFNLAEYCLPAAQVLGFCGLLNSTTNIILAGIERGHSFDESLAEAQRLGIAEANADYDVDGWDAAVKAVALANVLMDADARPSDVERHGIREVTSEDLRSAARDGNTIRLVARGERSGYKLRLRVAPEIIPLASPMGCARGTTNVLVINTDLMGELTVFEKDPGVEQTAYALLSDMIRIHDDLTLQRRRAY